MLLMKLILTTRTKKFKEKNGDENAWTSTWK
jgi:hypothetical protein